MSEEDHRVGLAVFLLCIVGLKPSLILSATDPSDISALNGMFIAMNSPGQLSQWTSSSGGDPCGQNWKGITCSNSRVTLIKLSGLGLSGSLGFALDKLTSVTEFDLSSNNLGGDLPYQLPPNVERLNLANNQFTGSAPYSISQMTPLKHLNLAHNRIKQLSIDFTKLTSLSILDLSSNTITGSLPNSMSSLTSAKSIYLQNNQFTGTIDVLATLPLENLNIANNQFTGWIPDSLKGINLQKDNNPLNSGPAPPPPPGTPPIHRSSPTPKSRNNNGSSSNNNGDSSTSSSNGDSNKSGMGAGGIAGIVISLLVVTAVIAFFLIKKRRSKKTATSTDIERTDDNVNQPQPFTLPSNDFNKAVQNPPLVETKKLDASSLSMNNLLRPPPAERHKSFDEDDSTPRKPIVVLKKPAIVLPSNVKAYTVADLQIATDSFSVDNLLGEGTFGRVYRAQFDDGKVLAVKKIDSSALPTTDDFTEIVSKIAGLDHENVTKLDGYCSEHGQRLVVYEFCRNGSLHEFLHLSEEEESKPLIWNPRVKIALGTARALEYLHEVCSPSIVHKNIKSANILLDAELNPHLSDAGLASFLPTANELLNQNDEGYSAPEVSMSGQYSLKSDVYSFGVVMLELLTGRKPFDSTRSRSEQSLVRWATPQLHDIDALGKMVDPALKGLYPVKSLSRFADVIALCVQPEPEFRPPMSEVVQALVVLVQRANMSKRTVGVGSGSSGANDYM
ncbi:protein STRUBBELIG-RECEPTOR FAMILY 7-like [Raphanus sativus]|uniref:Protein STRUBBELIG-RECEPTOR FAMILY 7 n=1 Tax=Raphanus sativus TaxID=3726 RepID=A0A6J0JXV5_RAPSA|nr:protein STRUBBELIG-RECEPTOR FAMILY 7 [Raphanus sativus]XP_056845626.1 protein STRUBBELIG-RECEPTOR FAMILY 7-like [Raphanus sativus]